MIVVVDTSVLIATLFEPTGFIARLLERAGAEKAYILCVSEAIIAEVQLKARELGFTAPEIKHFLTKLEDITVVSDTDSYAPAAVDSDDHILGCYLKSRANLVFTSDKALIRRLTKLGIAAVPPSQFKTYFPKQT